MIIQVPAGIGDFSWIYSKLVTLGEKLNVHVCKGGPARLAPIAELLPNILSIQYGNFGFGELSKRAIPPHTPKKYLFEQPIGAAIPMSINRHLEEGYRIEQWLPDVEVNHHYPTVIEDKYVALANSVHHYKDYICIFAANKNTCANWNGWMAPEWTEFMVTFRQEVADLPFVLIGANWDIQLGDEITKMAHSRRVPLVNIIGKTPLAASLHIVRQSKYFVSFPSGMGIMAHVLKQPCTMFYPKALEKMMGTYISPESRDLMRFHELQFCSPRKLVSWLVHNYKLKEKI